MNTHDIFIQAHRGFAYLELLLTAVFFISLLVVSFGYSGKINNLLRKSALFTMIVFHLQFLIGMVMLFGTSGFMDTMKELGMGGIMKNSELRFKYIEHPVTMLLAAVLMTIVNKKLKTNTHMKLGVLGLALLALVLFFLRFPFDKLFQ